MLVVYIYFPEIKEGGGMENEEEKRRGEERKEEGEEEGEGEEREGGEMREEKDKSQNQNRFNETHMKVAFCTS